MSKKAQFRVIPGKCLKNPRTEPNLENTRLYICKLRSSLLFKTTTSSLPLPQSKQWAPYEGQYFEDKFANNSLKQKSYESRICTKLS